MYISGYRDVNMYAGSSARGERYVVLILSPTSLTLGGSNNLESAKKQANRVLGRTVPSTGCFSGMPEKVETVMIFEKGKMVYGCQTPDVNKKSE